MDSKELFKLAFNSLKANKLRSLLTTLGIIIGVFSVILLVALGSGLQNYITSQISGLGSNLIFIIPGRIGGARTAGGQQTNKLVLNDAKVLAVKLKSLAQVGPIIQKTTTVKYTNKSNKNVSVLGTSANYPEIVKTEIILGAFFSNAQEKSGNRVALIGHTIYKDLFNFNNPIGKKLTIAGSKFTVIGVLKERGSVFGMDQDNIVVLPISLASKIFGVNNLNTIYLSAIKPEYVPLVKRQATEVLLKRLSEDDFTLQTQEQTLSTVTSITGVLTTALGGIAAISLLVGGIGVMNIMLVSVTERTKEIGLRKALGARRKDILLQFLLEAVILSLLGGIIGIIFGLLASAVMARFFVSTVTAWSVILAFVFSVAVGVLFGIAPAIRASRLSPIEALRYE